MENNDIRWVQRFSNFEKALKYLEEAMAIAKPDIIQRAGLIQFFEMSCELAWKTMKDYLEEQGFTEIKSPRDTVKKAFEIGIIADGHAWIQLLTDRNLTTHTYDEETSKQVEMLIHEHYYILLKELHNYLKNKNE